MQRFKKFIVVALFGATTVVGAAAPATTVSAATVGVDATIAEPLPVETGSLIAGSIPGCESPTVVTVNPTATSYGSTQVFHGGKEFICSGADAGDTLLLRYVAATTGCAPGDFGFWRVTGGTGDFAGRARGVLIGSYTLDGGPGDACSFDGINDRYIGFLRT